MSPTQGAIVAWQNRHALVRVSVAIAAAFAAFLLLIVAPLAALDSQEGAISGEGLPSGAQPFIAIYSDAGAVYRVSPFILMAIHENETGFSTSTLVGVRTGVNFAGCCAGPMQFSITGSASALLGGSGGTWGAYSMAFCKAKLPRPATYPNRFTSQPASSRKDGCHATAGRGEARPPTYATPNVYDSYDAIYAAASYLSSLGAGPTLDDKTHSALVHYTGERGRSSTPIADRDFQRAQEFERIAQSTGGAVYGGPVPIVPGARARLLPNGLAAAPEQAPKAIKGMVAAANEISNRPYLLLHYPSHLNNPTYDCSSSTSHVLWGGGVFGTAPWVSGQLMGYGEAGHGRWVSIFANDGHVFIYVAGLRFDTARYDTGPNAGESGPRWREGARPLDGFVVRHPEGL